MVAATIDPGLITSEARFLEGSHQTAQDAQCQDAYNSALIKEGELARPTVCHLLSSYEHVSRDSYPGNRPDRRKRPGTLWQPLRL